MNIISKKQLHTKQLKRQLHVLDQQNLIVFFDNKDNVVDTKLSDDELTEYFNYTNNVVFEPQSDIPSIDNITIDTNRFDYIDVDIGDYDEDYIVFEYPTIEVIDPNYKPLLP